ncbi:MAG: hypothetical protein VYA26_06570, partial [Actinomycetota bacterium]|nr:hypothetical protein [Actinomycetota bacterium]MED6329694.1 hypothetical protein [Actinomycetota bacterium]
MSLTGHLQHPCPIPITELIDLDRHPIDRPNSPGYSSMVDEARKKLVKVGCAVIPQLLASAALPIMSAEIREIRPFLHDSKIPINPYFSEGDPTLPADHAINTFIERSGGFIPRDAFDATSA